MKLKIEIDMDNAAFNPASGSCDSNEARRIIKELADSTLCDERLHIGDFKVLCDINENHVGMYEITE